MTLRTLQIAALAAATAAGPIAASAQDHVTVQRTGPIGASIQALGLAYRNGASRSSIASWGM